MESKDKAYLEKMEMKKLEWDKKIDGLQKQLEAKGNKAGSEVRKEMEKLMEMKLQLQEKLEEMKKTGKEAWPGLQGILSETLDSLGAAFDNFKKRLEV